MASIMKMALARLAFLAIHIVDNVACLFGYQIFKVNYKSVFKGLSPEEIAEAKDPSVVKPLNLYMEGFSQEAQLDALGRFQQIMTMKNVFKRRAGIAQALREYPDVINAPTKRPVFIIGFPRTGTTMLYHLLAQDDQFRAPMLWELLSPFPPGRPENWRDSPRYKKVAEAMALRNLLDETSFDVAHELRVDNPEECLIALTRNFLQYYYHVRFPSFSGVEEWYYSLTREEIAEAYRYYKKTLQLIGYKDLDNQKLLLKAHVHLLNLDALLDVFPDACLIFTYRKMTEVIPSFCSTIAKGTASWGQLDSKFGKRIVRMVAEFANRTVTTMKKYENVPKEQQPFFNIEYQDMIADPMGTIRSIYNQFSIPLTTEAEQRMRSWIASNPQHKHGRHRYSLEEYGLTEEDITSRMGPYLDYFKERSKNLV